MGSRLGNRLWWSLEWGASLLPGWGSGFPRGAVLSVEGSGIEVTGYGILHGYPVMGAQRKRAIFQAVGRAR